jgi:hypothetical protein
MMYGKNRNRKLDDNGKLNIQVASNLYLDKLYSLHQICKKKICEILKPSAPYLALTGNICHFCDEPFTRKVFLVLSSCFQKIIFVPGKREYECGNRHRKYTVEMLLEKAKKIAQQTNVIVLDRETIFLDGIIIIGATLWSHTPMVHKFFIEKTIYKKQNIFFGISEKISVKKINLLYNDATNFIKEELQKAKQNNHRCIVLTHHAPTLRNTFDPHMEGSIQTLAFASNLENLMGFPVHVWVFGHTVWCCDRFIQNSRLVNNSRGYSKKIDKMYKNNFVIGIDKIHL